MSSLREPEIFFFMVSLLLIFSLNLISLRLTFIQRISGHFFIHFFILFFSLTALFRKQSPKFLLYKRSPGVILNFGKKKSLLLTKYNVLLILFSMTLNIILEHCIYRLPRYFLKKIRINEKYLKNGICILCILL